MICSLRSAVYFVNRLAQEIPQPLNQISMGFDTQATQPKAHIKKLCQFRYAFALAFKLYDFQTTIPIYFLGILSIRLRLLKTSFQGSFYLRPFFFRFDFGVNHAPPCVFFNDYSWGPPFALRRVESYHRHEKRQGGFPAFDCDGSVYFTISILRVALKSPACNV